MASKRNSKEARYKRALAIAKKILGETPEEQLIKDIDEVLKLKIKGPTFDEYLDILGKMDTETILTNKKQYHENQRRRTNQPYGLLERKNLRKRRVSTRRRSN